MQFPVFIELRRSRFLAFLLVLFHLLATGGLLVLPWPWSIRLILILLVGLSASQSVRAPAVVGIRISTLDRLDCFMSDGNQHEATIMPCSAVFSRLIVLRLLVGESKKVISLTLLPDQMSVNQFRILSLWLRWRTEATAGSAKSL